MMRRFVAVAALLLAMAPAAMARRRAVTPGDRSCVLGTLLPATYANVLAADGQFVYLVDEMAMLSRVPKTGGARQDLAEPLESWLPLAMLVDDTTIYISALPIEAIFFPMPGSILAIPKNGGVVRVLASGAGTPFAMAMDATHVYWAAAGILDFEDGEFQPGGKVERIAKDGTGRQALADDLSAPLAVAIDENHVYFGESGLGLADGDPELGLYRVPKGGGAITAIDENLVVIGLGIDGNTLVVVGGTEASGPAMLAIDKSGATPARTLLVDESMSFTVRIADRRAYVMAEREYTELLSVSIDNPGPATVVRSELDGDAFVIDGCAAIVNTIEGNVVRTAR
jgi:hypothetical protein